MELVNIYENTAWLYDYENRDNLLITEIKGDILCSEYFLNNPVKSII